MRVEIVHTGGRYSDRVIAYFSEVAPENVDAYQVPQWAPSTLEAVESLPTELGSGDIIIALNLQPQLLLAIPGLVSGAGTQALIVPVEDVGSVKPALQRQLLQACRDDHLEVAFPKPFCALEPSTPVVTRFCEEFGVGASRLLVELQGGRINAINVLRGAPCGLTDYIAEGLLGLPADAGLAGQIEHLHSIYPCLGTATADPADGGSSQRISLSLLQSRLKEAVARHARP